MTIQLNIGLQPVQALPSLSKEAYWVDGLPHDNLCNLVEFSALNSLKLQYTSLRDLIVLSPTERGSPRVKKLQWCDLKFKDKLLKQAARAYLQPIGKEVTPKTHFFARCWKSFTAKSMSLFVSIKEYIESQAGACVKFFRAQVFGRIQHFKPHYLGFLHVRPHKPC